MSIFHFRGPLLPDSLLYKGRQSDLAKLLRWCQGQTQHYGIVLGARQSGKSSLLLRLEQRLAASHTVCHTDFEYLSQAAPPRVFGALAGDFARAFAAPAPAAEIPDALHFSEYLCSLLEANPARRVVLLIEELGALPPVSRFALANALRALFNDRQRPARRMLARLMVIVAGNTELYDLAYTDVSPFANICETHYLVDLSEPEAVSLIQEGLALLDIPAEQAARLGADIYALAHGYPYLTQRLGHALESALDSGARLSAETLEQATDELITSGDPIVGHLQKVMHEQGLFPAAQSVLNEKLRFNRHEEALARLELAGFLRPENGFWQVRNPLYARAVRSWLTNGEQAGTSALNRGLVRIFNRHGQPVGAGFLVAGNRILTCAHVVSAALGSRDLSGQLSLDFPLLTAGTRLQAAILPIRAFDDGAVNDLALLELLENPPAGAAPLTLARKPAAWGQPFRVCGFPVGREDGAWATGVLRGPISDGRIQIEDTKSTGYPIQPGFSGSPIWDETTHTALGLVVAADTEPGVKAAFTIPAKELEKFIQAL